MALVAEAEGHHPDIELGWGRAQFDLTTHAASGLTRNDFVMAAKIDRAGAARGVTVSLEAEMLAHIKAGVEHHNATCPMPARAILLNAGNFELFGWDEIFGLPVEPRDDIPPKRFRIDCPGLGLRDRGGDRRGGRRAARRARAGVAAAGARTNRPRLRPLYAVGSRPSPCSFSRCASSVSARPGAARGRVVPHVVEQLVV